MWLGALLGLFVLGMSARLPETRVRHTLPRSPILHFGRLRDLAPPFRLTYLVLIYATFAAGLRNSVVSAILPLHAGVAFGYSTTEVGALFAVMGAVTLAVMGPAGWISDKIGRKAATVPAALLSGRSCRTRTPTHCRHCSRFRSWLESPAASRLGR